MPIGTFRMLGIAPITVSQGLSARSRERTLVHDAAGTATSCHIASAVPPRATSTYKVWTGHDQPAFAFVSRTKQGADAAKTAAATARSSSASRRPTTWAMAPMMTGPKRNPA